MAETVKKETDSAEQTKAGAPVRVSTKEDLKKMFDSEFASSVNYIYINSLGKELGFKEISVMQQKTLSRTMVANENRKDIVYDAQCGLLNNVCVAEGFDIYGLTEFDRLKLMIALYQANMFSNDVKFTCKKCGCENQYKFNFDSVLAKLDKFDTDPKEFEYENRNFRFVFTVAYPLVRTVSDFHKSYCAKHKVVNKQQARTDENMSNMEYVNLYIQKVKVENKRDGSVKEVDFRDYAASDLEEIIQIFPQDALYSDSGVLKYIVENYVKAINDSFEKHACYQCGAENEEGDVNSPESFF